MDEKDQRDCRGLPYDWASIGLSCLLQEDGIRQRQKALRGHEDGGQRVCRGLPLVIEALCSTDRVDVGCKVIGFVRTCVRRHLVSQDRCKDWRCERR